MNLIDALIREFAPVAAVRRAQARAALKVIESHYDAATTTRRGGSWRVTNADADAASGRRDRLRYIARDMLRNTPLAVKGQMVITNNVVGAGIIPKIEAGNKALKAQIQALALAHLDTTKIDAEGRNNLYGLQRLAMNAIVDAGEVLIRRRRRERRDGLPLPFQLQLLEADFIDTSKHGQITGGGFIREGIEFDAEGRRVAYWLFDEHPGAAWYRPGGMASRRVPASEILHIYRQDRPGQRRGVTWFAPVAMRLQDLDDADDAHLMRQKIAACFAGFIYTDEDVAKPASSDPQEDLQSIVPGRLQRLKNAEQIVFPTPPGVEGYDDFARGVLRATAAGLGITYESLSGDLARVNYSSARVGRIEMNRNVESWQWLMLVPLMMQPIGEWFLQACALQLGRQMPATATVDWVPPPPILLDPGKEIEALRDEVRAGFGSRQNAIRRLGYDPEVVLAEQIEDAAAADAAKLAFDSDARVARPSQAPAANRAPEQDDQTQNEEPDDG